MGLTTFTCVFIAVGVHGIAWDTTHSPPAGAEVARRRLSDCPQRLWNSTLKVWSGPYEKLML